MTSQLVELCNNCFGANLNAFGGTHYGAGVATGTGCNLIGQWQRLWRPRVD